MLVIERRFSDIRFYETETSTTIEGGSGDGGGNVPMILESNQNHATAKDTEVVNALPASMGMGGGYVPMIVEPIGADLYNQTTTGSKSKTLNAIKSDSDHVPCVIEPIAFRDDVTIKIDTNGVGYTLSDRDYKGVQCVVTEDEDVVRG